MNGELKCPLCPFTCGAAITLFGHAKKEHPDSYDTIYPLIRKVAADELAARRLAVLAAAATGKIHPKLEGIFHHCPCTESYAWHVQQVKSAAGRA